jgi:hypothetical protein
MQIPRSFRSLISRIFLYSLASSLTALSVSLAQSESDTRAPAIAVPPAQALPAIAPPPAAPMELFVAPPDRQQIERAKPQVQAWRDGSDIAQTPRRYGDHFKPVLIPPNE